MNITRIVSALCFASFVAACSPAGYYDTNGKYHDYGKDDSMRHDNTPMPGGQNPPRCETDDNGQCNR